MTLHFPVLRGQDRPFLPSRGQGCLVCGKPLRDGFAYIGAGATYDVDPEYEDDPLCRALRDNEACEIRDDPSEIEQVPEKRFPELEAFFYVGYHGKDPEMSDSGGMKVVDDLAGGQFDLQFCSTSCLRQFFAAIVDEVEKSIGKPQPLPANFVSPIWGSK